LLGIKFSTVLKAIFLGVVFAVLIGNEFISLKSIEAAISRWPWILAGWCCMLITTILSITRWHYLMLAQGVPIAATRTFQFAFVGLFFSMFLPGTVSGDLVKGYYVVRRFPGYTTGIISSILFDRIIGFSALIVLAAITLIAGNGSEWMARLGTPVILPIAAGMLAVSLFYAGFLTIDEKNDPILKLGQNLPPRLTFLTGFFSIYSGIRVYHGKKVITLTGMVVSVLGHSTFAIGWICLIKAMGVEGIPWSALFVVVPIGMLFTAIPIAPAGIGTGHAAFLAMFALLGSVRGADLFNLALAFQLVQAVIGGLVYLFLKAEDPLDSLHGA
jgi:uncharacterized protein (TIRG00374 family)